MTTALTQSAAWAGSWLHGTALPFWAEQGVDPRGGFREALKADGTPPEPGITRVRVQARQTFCFALAHVEGWSPDRAAALAGRGLDVIADHGMREDGLPGRTLVPSRGMVDASADLYDCAFVLLAAAWCARVPALRARALQCVAGLETAIDAHLRRPDGQGYAEILPAPARRAQNPHMHLYEASIAAAAFAGSAAARQRVEALENFVFGRFFDAGGGVLCEFADPADAGWVLADHVEPGHLFEWVWLIDQRATLLGPPMRDLRASLYRAACVLSEPDGRVQLAKHRDGAPRDAGRRPWGLTEAMKAHLAMARAGDVDALPRALRCLALIREDHLTPAVPGCWLEHYGPDGAPRPGPVPASTFYHLSLGMAELCAFARSQS